MQTRPRAIVFEETASETDALSASFDSVCVFCGSSDEAPTPWRRAAARLGCRLAGEGLRLVYGGGGVGLMGECARAARAAGGRVLGVIPRFLVPREAAFGDDTVVVDTMHARKLLMFQAADAFVVLPGGIGTLEEAVELLSWRRLALHAKPIVFYNPAGFWEPLFELFERFTKQHLAPAELADCWGAVDDIDSVLPCLRAMPTDALRRVPVIETLL